MPLYAYNNPSAKNYTTISCLKYKIGSMNCKIKRGCLKNFRDSLLRRFIARIGIRTVGARYWRANRGCVCEWPACERLCRVDWVMNVDKKSLLK